MAIGDAGLTQAVKDLTSALRNQAGMMRQLPNVFGGNNPTAGGKNTNELLSDLSDNMEKLTETMGKSIKSTDSNKDTLAQHLKGLEMLGAALAIAGPLIQQATKYGYVRPYEMLGGTMGQVGGRMMERERDTGAIVTSAIAALSLLIPGIGVYAAGAIAGLGQAGINQMIGRQFQPRAIEAAGMEQAARLATERVIGARDSMYLNYRLGRLDAAGTGMRGIGGYQAAGVLAEMGLTGDQGADVLARVQAVGARGYERFSMRRAKNITEMGIYGQDVGAIAEALQIGNRTGFSEAELLRGSRRTGFQLPVVAQAAQQARGQYMMYGMGAGNEMFNAATNTTIGQIMGPAAAMAAISQTGQATAAASAGDEASSMLLYRQFIQANPGSTYLDFVEARTMKEASPKWRKMMAAAAGAYGGSQAMRIAGVSLGLYRGAGAEAVSTSTRMLREAAGLQTAGEITSEGKQAVGTAQFVNLGISDFNQGISAAGQMINEFGNTINTVSQGLSKVAVSADTMSKATIDSANIMKTKVISSFEVLDRTMTDFARRYGIEIYATDSGQRRPNGD